MLQRTQMLQRMNAKKEQFLPNNVRMLQRTHILQRTMLQRMNDKKEQFLSVTSGFYNEHTCYNER
jgi:hypothetical protein